jgi:hypothetical protein
MKIRLNTFQFFRDDYTHRFRLPRPEGSLYEAHVVAPTCRLVDLSRLLTYSPINLKPNPTRNRSWGQPLSASLPMLLSRCYHVVITLLSRCHHVVITLLE